MKFYKTSRKDDLVSLVYMILYLLNEDELPFKDDEFLDKLLEIDGDVQKTFKLVLK
jgi:hypothetical protein